MGMRPDLVESVLTHKPVQLLDGTPGTFAAIFKATLDLPIRRMLIVKADTPHAGNCVMCDEPGGEYTVMASLACADDGGNFDDEIVWPIHQKHFESSVDDGEEVLHGS